MGILSAAFGSVSLGLHTNTAPQISGPHILIIAFFLDSFATSLPRQVRQNSKSTGSFYLLSVSKKDTHRRPSINGGKWKRKDVRPYGPGLTVVSNSCPTFINPAMKILRVWQNQAPGPTVSTAPQFVGGEKFYTVCNYNYFKSSRLKKHLLAYKRRLP